MWIALELLKGRDTITMSEIIKIFDCIEEEDKIFDASWFKDILFKIKVEKCKLWSSTKTVNIFRSFTSIIN